MNFDTFFSERDRMNAIDAAKAMVFLPENCYFVEEPKPEIDFYLNDHKEIMAKVIISYKNDITEIITDKPFTLKFHEKGLKQTWEYIDTNIKDSWLL